MRVVASTSGGGVHSVRGTGLVADCIGLSFHREGVGQKVTGMARMPVPGSRPDNVRQNSIASIRR